MAWQQWFSLWPSNQGEISGKIGIDTQNGDVSLKQVFLDQKKLWKNHKWAECVLHPLVFVVLTSHSRKLLWSPWTCLLMFGLSLISFEFGFSLLIRQPRWWYLKKTFACSDVKNNVRCNKPTQSRCLVAWLLGKNKRKVKLQGMDYRNTAGICPGIWETRNQVLFSKELQV